MFSNGSREAAYPNYFSPTEGSICCLDNDKMKDDNEAEDRLEWSEVIFQLHQMEAARTLQLTRNLKIVWRLYIINSVTPTILGEARAQVANRKEGLPYGEYRQGDGGFFALLGCPNGSGVVRMLIDHCDALGHKNIASVRCGGRFTTHYVFHSRRQ